MTSSSQKSRNKHHLKLAASAGDDPIYAAIDRHKAAVAATEAGGENVPQKLLDRDNTCARALMATVPATRAGLLAMLGYVRQAEEAQSISLGSNDDRLVSLLSSIETAVRTLPEDESASAPAALMEMEAPLLDASGLAKARDARSIIAGMETTTNDAFWLATALSMAINGRDGIAAEEEDKLNALEALAYLVCDATKKCKEELTELNELK